MFPVKRIPTLISENTMRYLKTTYLENGQRIYTFPMSLAIAPLMR